MQRRFLYFLIVLALFVSLLTWGQSAPKNGGDFSNNVQPLTKVPEGVVLVKGAWSSASDSVTPVPEGGNVTNNVFRDQYFGMTYALPKDWTEKYKNRRCILLPLQCRRGRPRPCGPRKIRKPPPILCYSEERSDEESGFPRLSEEPRLLAPITVNAGSLKFPAAGLY